jgi:drug/metabolite transporter (DMT)-like permease
MNASNPLLLAILSGIGGMFGWGLADFFAKKTIDRLGDIETLFWGQVFGIVPLAVLFAIKPVLPAFSGLQWAFVAVLGAWSGLSYIPTYVAFGKGKVSLLSPLFASYAVVVALLSAFLLHEHIPNNRIAVFAIVFIGVILISGDPRAIWSFVSGKRLASENGAAGTREIALAIALYSLWLIALDWFLNGRYWVPILLGIRVCSALSLYVYARGAGRGLTVKYRELWPYLILIGFCDVAAFSFVSFGYSTTSYVSVITMLSGAFSLPTIVLARMFLKERATPLQTAGSALVIVGILLLPFA